MVRALAVTFSPVSPSPRVAAPGPAGRPRSAATATGRRSWARRCRRAARPARGRGSGAPARRTRSTSASAKAFSRLSIGRACRTLAKASEGAAPDPLRRAVGAAQLGKPRLDRGVAALQRVVVGVRDPRRVLLVVGAVRVGERLRPAPRARPRPLRASGPRCRRWRSPCLSNSGNVAKDLPRAWARVQHAGPRDARRPTAVHACTDR